MAIKYYIENKVSCVIKKERVFRFIRKIEKVYLCRFKCNVLLIKEANCVLNGLYGCIAWEHWPDTPE